MKTFSLIVVSPVSLSFHIFDLSQADDSTIIITEYTGRFATGEH
jgi:hypothetical protein